MIPFLLALSSCFLAAPAAAQAASQAAIPGPTPVTGRILDAVGRRPLSDYLLEITNGTQVERVTTDADGRFAGSLAFAPGPVELRALDAESVSTAPTMGGLPLPSCGNAPRKAEWKGAPIEWEVAAGPTFELKLAARQPEGAPVELASSIAFLEATSPGAVDEGTALRAGVRSDGGARRWVRFAPLPAGTFGTPHGTRLVVWHGDGLWRAEADVASTLDARGGVVELTWQPCARWIGLLRGAGGRPLGGAWVVLTRTNEQGTVVARRRARTNERGRYEFLALEPGTWRLEGEPLRYNPFKSEPRVLAAGTPSQLNLALDPVRETEPLFVHVRGRPVEPDGAPPPEAEVVLRRAGETLPLETLRVAWSVEEGRYGARVTFPALPKGAYQVQFLPPAGDEEAWPTRSVAGRTSPDPLVIERAAPAR